MSRHGSSHLSLLALASLLPLLSSCGADPVAEDGDVELSVAAAEAPDEKADRAAFALTALDLPVPASVGTRESRQLVKTAASYRALFGASAPAVDFSQRWVVFYSAGRRPTGGYSATIERVDTSASGAELRVRTALLAPGTACRPPTGATVPHAAVSFPRPRVTPTSWRAEHRDERRACTTSTCRTIAPTDLQTLDLTVTRKVRAVYFTPSDRPFRSCLSERLGNFARLARDFYATDMAAAGYRDAAGQGKTFALDATAAGDWNVVYLVGQHDAAWYQAQPDAPGAAMAEMFARLPAAYHARNVTLYIYDLATVAGRTIKFSGNGGSGAPWEGDSTGYVLQGAHFLGVGGFDTIAVDPKDQAAVFEQTADAGVDDWNGDQAFGPLTRGQYASTYVGAALHELGHAFYLDHVFTDYDGDGIETNLMGNGFRRLSGRYTPRGYRPATTLGPDHAAALDRAWMFNR